MSGNFHTSEYSEETNEMINRKTKSALRKIHKLKRENLVLSDKRHSMYLKLRKFDSTTLGFLDTFLEALKISELIGKFTSINSHLEGNEEFLVDIEILMKIADETYNTDFEVKIKFKDGDVTLEHDDYYCGY